MTSALFDTKLEAIWVTSTGPLVTDKGKAVNEVFYTIICAFLIWKLSDYGSQILSAQQVVKPWVIQSFLTFDSMDTTRKCDDLLESC